MRTLTVVARTWIVERCPVVPVIEHELATPVIESVQSPCTMRSCTGSAS